MTRGSGRRACGASALGTPGLLASPSRVTISLPAQRRQLPKSPGPGTRIHPHDASCINETPDWENALADALKSSPAYGTREIGLDFHYMHSPKDVQEEAFRLQIRLAHALAARDSSHAGLKTARLRFCGRSRLRAGAVLHAFTGTPEQFRGRSPWAVSSDAMEW